MTDPDQHQTSQSLGQSQDLLMAAITQESLGSAIMVEDDQDQEGSPWTTAQSNRYFEQAQGDINLCSPLKALIGPRLSLNRTLGHRYG